MSYDNFTIAQIPTMPACGHRKRETTADIFDDVQHGAHGLRSYVNELVEEIDVQIKARQRGVAWTKTDVVRKFDNLVDAVTRMSAAVAPLREK